MSTYTPIASITLASAASSVTFSGIPQTYTDLVLVSTGVLASGGADRGLQFQVNSDTGSNYSITYLDGNGTAASSGRDSSNTFGAIGLSSSSTQCVNIAHFMNYANTTTNKTIIARGNNSGSRVRAAVSLWRSTAAINSIVIYDTANNLASGSTFNLYGIANASITNVAKATGGDSVYTDGTYWYHIFRSSGTFTPTQALTADYLVVAGGGGGGSGTNDGGRRDGGGGGAGGLRCTVTATGGGGSLESALSLTASTNYTVTVGAGGAGGAAGGNAGTQGSDSVFSTITSTGGGFGGKGAASGTNGGSGGSGGGGGAISPGTSTGGARTTNQGYDGGTGTENAGGGGGGAGAAGQNAPGADNAGNGGNGVATSISGSSVTYAGGGGGGDSTGSTGGTGGGGNGGTNGGAGSAGSANTGSGGGGGGQNTGANPVGGAGGSGIVVIRYSAA